MENSTQKIMSKHIKVLCKKREKCKKWIMIRTRHYLMNKNEIKKIIKKISIGIYLRKTKSQTKKKNTSKTTKKFYNRSYNVFT